MRMLAVLVLGNVWPGYVVKIFIDDQMEQNNLLNLDRTLLIEYIHSNFA